MVLMKKVFTSMALAMTVVLSGLLLMPNVANAAGGGGGGGGSSVDCIEQTTLDAFLSFPPWYRGLDCEDTDGDGKANGIVIAEGSDPSAIVFTVALNIIDIALRLIGILAVGFVIWGGFQYIISRGEPERTKSGLTTIRNALIGMVISMVAAFVVSFVVGRLNP
jgi:hypothetical protein